MTKLKIYMLTVEARCKIVGAGNKRDAVKFFKNLYPATLKIRKVEQVK